MGTRSRPRFNQPQRSAGIPIRLDELVVIPLDVSITVSSSGNKIIINQIWTEAITAGVEGILSDTPTNSASTVIEGTGASYRRTVTLPEDIESNGNFNYKIRRNSAISAADSSKRGPSIDKNVQIAYGPDIGEGVSKYVTFDIPEGIQRPGIIEVDVTFSELPDGTVGTEDFILDGIKDASFSGITPKSSTEYTLSINIPENSEGILNLRLKTQAEKD